MGSKVKKAAGGIVGGVLGGSLLGRAPRGTGVDAALGRHVAPVYDIVGGVARGETPSVAAKRFELSLDEAAKRQNQIAASMRGISPALANRIASDSIAQQQLQAAAQSGLLEEEERRRAQELILNQYAGQRALAMDAKQRQADRRAGFIGAIGTSLIGGLLGRENSEGTR